MCGLATENSDIDMCLLVKPCVADTRTDAVTNLEHIRNILENCGKWDDIFIKFVYEMK